MKKILLLISFSLLTSFLFAQSITDEGNEWRIAYYDWMQGYITRANNLQGDTLINGKVYKKIYSGTDSSSSHISYFIREDSTKKVFSPYYDTEIVLYDFGAEVGDTLFSWQDSTQSAIVESIDSILLSDGSMRKRQKIVSLECPHILGPEYWVEGVGGMSIFPFGDLSEFCTFDGGHALNCFSSNEEILIGPRLGVACDLILNTSNLKKSSFSISPNPASDFIYITLEDSNQTEKGIFEVINIYGKVLLQMERSKIISASRINLNKYPNGIYFIQYLEEGVMRRVEKIIISR